MTPIPAGGNGAGGAIFFRKIEDMGERKGIGKKGNGSGSCALRLQLYREQKILSTAFLKVFLEWDIIKIRLRLWRQLGLHVRHVGLRRTISRRRCVGRAHRLRVAEGGLILELVTLKNHYEL